MQDGIVPILSGGLGNNLFIIATSLIVKKKLNCPIYLFYNNHLDNKHNKLLHNYNKLLFQTITEELDQEKQNFIRKNYG